MGVTKGSTLALEHMAKIRATRKNKQATQSMINNVEPVETNRSEGETPKRRGRLIKGSIEAKQYMASIRAKNKQS